MIHTIVGTKAQLIKMAPVIREIHRRKLPMSLVFTGQHVAGMEDLRRGFDLPPWNHDLGGHSRDVTGVFQMLLWGLRCLYRFFRHKRTIFAEPGVVLIHGDTVSTLLGGFMGRWLGWKVAHVEAGLRSFDILRPFPEEITRRIVRALSDIHLAPGDWARENLQGECGVTYDTVENTLLDSLRLALERRGTESVDVPSDPYAIATIHRFENVFFRKKLQRIVEILLELSEGIHIVFILHKPTEKNLRRFGLYERLAATGRIEMRERLAYFPFVRLMSQAKFVISDGGSNQEECAHLGLPCLLLRRRTERIEGLGENVCLSEFDPDKIRAFLADVSRWRPRDPRADVFPSGLVVDALEEQLAEMRRERAGERQ